MAATCALVIQKTCLRRGTPTSPRREKVDSAACPPKSRFFFFFFFFFNFLVNDGRAATMTDWGCLTLFGGEEKKKKRKEKPKSILIIHTKSVDFTKLPQRETMRTRMHHHQAGGSSTSELISAGCPLNKKKKKKKKQSIGQLLRRGCQSADCLFASPRADSCIHLLDCMRSL